MWIRLYSSVWLFDFDFKTCWDAELQYAGTDTERASLPEDTDTPRRANTKVEQVARSLFPATDAFVCFSPPLTNKFSSPLIR
jgi:hypothetical protein